MPADPSGADFDALQEDAACWMGAVAALGARYSGAPAVPEWRNRQLCLSTSSTTCGQLRIRRQTVAQTRGAAREALAAVGLAVRLDHKPAQLSGGERQRGAIARALVTRPARVLADEPTGNLDRSSADNVFGLMLDLARERGTAFVLVTHDVTLAARCQRRLQLEQGRLVDSTAWACPASPAES